MLQRGKSEAEIIEELRNQGKSAKQISDALAQSKIKSAVAEPDEYSQQLPVPAPSKGYSKPSTQEYQDLEPSMLQPGQQEMPYPQEQTQTPIQEAIPEYQYQEYPQQEYYQQYEPSGISSDTITEISEQVVSEKLSDLRKDLEKAIDFQSAVESKIDYLDDRLKRIEKVIDRLQLSILQKVGDYMTSVTDVKKELTETQKSFKKLLPQLREISGEKPKRKKRK